jgi:hypothetical protein
MNNHLHRTISNLSVENVTIRAACERVERERDYWKRIAEGRHELIVGKDVHLQQARKQRDDAQHANFNLEVDVENLKSALQIAREALQVSKADHENRGDYYDGYCTTALRRIDELMKPCPH